MRDARTSRSDKVVAAFDDVTVRVDYCTGAVTAATGHTARVWANAPGAVVGSVWGLSFGTDETDLEPQAPSPVLAHDFAAAVAALAVTLTARSLGRRTASISRLIRLIEVTVRHAPSTATPAEAERAVRVVRRAARWMPARVACLEESVAAVLLLSMRRRRATWCHGIAPDPIQFHAWIQIDGRPVAEPATTSKYTVLYTTT
ncbi:hypothetical protein GCM10027059_07120 [Myceligenerans halotolerans]